MRVTAVIPCHNHVNWVCDTIQSVAEQDHDDLRIVVVDDGSTDSSLAVITRRLVFCHEKKGYAFGHWHNGEINRELFLIRLDKSRGPSFARNRGMEFLWKDTEVFAFLDSDDVYLPGKISLSVERFKGDLEHVGVVYTDFETVNPTGLRLVQYKPPFSRAALEKECIINCDSLVNKKAVEACGAFDETLRVCEDYDFWLRLTERFLAVHVAEPLVSIRVGGHSSTSTIDKQQWERCYKRVFEKLTERRQKCTS